MRPSLTQPMFMSVVIVFITVSRPVAMQTAYRACAPLTEVYHIHDTSHTLHESLKSTMHAALTYSPTMALCLGRSALEAQELSAQRLAALAAHENSSRRTRVDATQTASWHMPCHWFQQSAWKFIGRESDGS